MVNYQEILRLHSLGSSQRNIAREVQSSRDTVADVIKAASAAGLSWPLDEDVTNEDIQEILFPRKYSNASPYIAPDCQWIHTELAKKGVTLTLLWDEYCRKARSADGVPYMYTQFCEKYRRWARVTKATMRITHKPGDAMQVDWAGDPLLITDPVTGELSPAYIFVAVLPCSFFTYAEACEDMKQENWLLCHVHAFNYFGGVTRLLIPDNAKTATVTNNRYEVVLNRSYQEMAEHYGTAIVPARVRKPDDKAAVEGSVRFVSTWITAALRDLKFFSIAETKTAVREKLEELNLRLFKGSRAGCRLTAYEQEEKAFMQPLPIHAYEPSVWLSPKVGCDYLISDGLNKYSVPYDLIGEKVDVKLTKHVVEIFYDQSRVAVHVQLALMGRDMQSRAPLYLGGICVPKINAYNVLSIINEELDRQRCETLFNGFGYKDSDKRAYSEHALNELHDHILECCEHKKFEMKPLGEFIDMLVSYREKLFACRKIAYRKPGNITKMFDIAIDETNAIINTLIAMG